MFSQIKDTHTPERTISIANRDFFYYVKIYLDEGKRVLFSVRGNSMWPFLKSGEQIILISSTGKKLCRGNVVLVKVDEDYILHRIVHFSKDEIWLAGDANLIQHEKIMRKDVLGIMVAKVLNGKEQDVNTFFQFFIALIWYMLRPFRWLVFKSMQVLKK